MPKVFLIRGNSCDLPAMLEMLVDLRALFGSMVTFPNGKAILLKEA